MLKVSWSITYAKICFLHLFQKKATTKNSWQAQSPPPLPPPTSKHTETVQVFGQSHLNKKKGKQQEHVLLSPSLGKYMFLSVFKLQMGMSKITTV